jgi:hypothetical protein
MEGSLVQAVAVLVQVAMGLSLAACAGLRAFLPLFVVGVAGKLDLLPLLRSFEWLESWPALTVLGAAVLAELLGDKFPVVDNLLDTVQLFVKPVAGVILMTSVLTELSPLQAAVLGLIAGSTAAGAVHVTKAKLRLASTATTAGVGNPFLSLLEDAGALLGSVSALVVPVVMVLMLILAIVLAWLAISRWRRRSPSSGSAVPQQPA